jgi:hypothetical protein
MQSVVGEQADAERQPLVLLLLADEVPPVSVDVESSVAVVLVMSPQSESESPHVPALQTVHAPHGSALQGEQAASITAEGRPRRALVTGARERVSPRVGTRRVRCRR